MWMVEENFSEFRPSDKILIIQQSGIKSSNSGVIHYLRLIW
jgi:hypothetical protein